MYPTYPKSNDIQKIGVDGELSRLGQLQKMLKALKLSPTQDTDLDGDNSELPYFWVAGGAIRDFLSGVQVTDFDLFFRNQEEFQQMFDFLTDHGDAEHKILVDNENVTKIRLNKMTVDLVKKFFDGPANCLKSFDFTVSAFAFDGEYLYTSTNSLIDLATKRLALNRTELLYPVSTLKRVAKYVSKGFIPCVGTMLALGKNLIEVKDEAEFQELSKFYLD